MGRLQLMGLKLLRNKFSTVLELVAFAVLGILQGYHLGIGDLSTYLAFVWHKYDPQLLQYDLLIETLSDHPVYIWDVVAAMLHFGNIQQVFLALFFLQTALMTLSAYLFYRHFFGDNSGWRIFMLTLVIGAAAPAMGQYGLNPYHYFHPNVLGIAIILLGTILLDRGRWLSAAALLSSIFLFHPFSAIYAGLMFGWCWIFSFRKLTALQRWGAPVLFLMVAAPAWLPMLPKIFGGTPADFDLPLWFALVRQRMQFSFFASEWIVDRWLQLGGAALVCFVFRSSRALHRLLPLCFAVLTALIVFVLADLLSIKFLLQLQLARNSYLLFIVASALITNHIATREASPRLLVGWLLLGYVLMVEKIIDQPGFDGRPIYLAILAAILLYLVLRQPQSWRRIYLMSGFMVVYAATFIQVYHRYHHTGRIFDTTLTTAWEDMQLWCAENTPIKAVILTPVYREGFRSFSRRAIWGTYKDGAPHNYSSATIFRWWERMQEFGITLPWQRQQFPLLYHQNAMEVARRNQLSYIVVEKKYAVWPLAPLYQNKEFAVYHLLLKQNSQ
jgi:hypothetical protein